ncbi:MAG: bacillithiol system redox-active protein YtxJ [Cyclobacteriaceae bacterium]|nr:bacillithiol system redox-active protein YtxJ [Cyclobacteriaceae bacterium]MCH8516599.1 bacillithiol system redox-active protein YtxJ [Cyclobacteriaceae bacterium]
MNWINLKEEYQIQDIKQASLSEPVLIYKHSTRCSISSMALNRLERGWEDGISIKTYFLDLISYRNLSNAVASEFGVMHESPQVLLIKDQECIFHESHMGINFEALKKAL